MLRKKQKPPGEDKQPLVDTDKTLRTTNNRLDVRTRSWTGNFVVALRYVWAETTKNKRNFMVGCTAIFLVVMSIGYEVLYQNLGNESPRPRSHPPFSLLQNTVDNSGVLFLKLAEDTVGEMDLVWLLVAQPSPG